MRPNDPRIRQTLNQISNQIESANLSTQASLFTFSQDYVSPCLSSFKTCLEASCQPCYACYSSREDQRRSHRGIRRGRDNLGFDFYDDWDEEEESWGNDELDRLLAGSDEQPGRRAGMSYGSGIVGRKNIGGLKDKMSDSNVVPRSSVFGFLERLPWKIGGRGVRYRPSIADLQENVGRGNREAEPLLEDSDESAMRRGRHGRNRSGTTNSRSTTNSLSSRGDLFPSEDEDDAVPLDDEFAMVLERRNTGATSDDRSSKNTSSKKPARSRTSTKTASSKDTKSSQKRRRSASISSGKVQGATQGTHLEAPSMVDLKQEEDQVRREEEDAIKTKREAAQQLAKERGLNDVTQGSNVSKSLY